MAAVQPSLLAAVLPLVFFVLHCSSSSPLCPESCTCQGAPLLLLNCSSSGLSAVPRLVQDSVTELDLSHNLLSSVTLHQPHHNLRNVWLGNNSITHLSLCVERNLKDRYLRRRWGTRSRTRCLAWAPALQLLSAERNQLEQLPEGLGGVTSLQVLKLSFNRISALHPGMLHHLRQLKELHLQHNLISYLHPQTFQDLDQLRVLDLSFNMLTSLHPLIYITWSNIRADVKLGGNKWQCDCSMRSLRRRMAYDSSRGLQTWSIECAFPSTISGRDLLQLDEEDLNCSSTENSPVLHQDVTVYSGSEILLSCSAQDSMWWTPSGQASVSQDNAGLLVSDVSEKDTGLYVCVSAEDQVMSVFNLQISKRGGARKARSLPREQSQSLPEDRIGGEKTQRSTQSQLALAVCLSVFITFLVAFILGVLARPWIDVLWRRVTKKKSPSAANTVSSVEQRQYDNEAFSNAEDPEEPGPFRERRVTFSTVDFIEDRNVQYYDTVASGDQDSIGSDAVTEGQVAEGELYEQNTGDSGSKRLQMNSSEDRLSDSGSGESNEQRTHNMEFEHIPDPSELEERRSLSSRSDSSLSEKVSEEDQIIERKHINPKSPLLVEVSVQQRPDFLQDNEELFEFSDSAQSPTVRPSSMIDSFNNLKQTQVPTSEKQKIEDMSSSSSYISEDEPTHYTVNSDQETEESDNHGVQIKSSYDTKKPTVRPHLSLSSDSSDSDKEPLQSKRKQKTMKERNEKYMYDKTKLSSRIVTAKTDFGEKETPMLVPATYSFSSSTESEEEIADPKARHHRSRIRQTVTVEPGNEWPVVDFGKMTRLKRRLDIKAPSPSSDSSSSSESEEETTSYIKKQEKDDIQMTVPSITVSQTVKKEQETQQLTVDLGQITGLKRRLDIKAPSLSSDASSSNGSEDETTGHVQKQMQGDVQIQRPSIIVPHTVTGEQENRWPSVNLGQKTRLKRRLDIKGPSPNINSSSSSEREEETTGHMKKQEQNDLQMTMPSAKVSQTVTEEPENRWPTVDLGQKTRLKRRLDIKGPSPNINSSSSSESEEETTGHMKKQEQNDLQMTMPSIKVSQTVTEEPENRWPTVDLGQMTRIKRHIDIKTLSPSTDSSASSESEEETTGFIKKQEQEELQMSRPSVKVTQSVTKEPENQWPAVDLGRITQIKRRLDIKAPSTSSDSSSSSDSEDETTGHTQKQEQDDLQIKRLSTKGSQTVRGEPENRWPTVDLGRVTRIKRRLDIKAPSASIDSSSSSESEDVSTHFIKKQEQKELQMTTPPINVTQNVTKEGENQWPALDLGQITQIKRRLDFKAPSPSTDLSSVNDAVYETIVDVTKQEQKGLLMVRPQTKVSQGVTSKPENQWPALDLGQVTQIKRRLDFKAPLPSADSSSINDAVYETIDDIKKEEQEELQMSRPLIKVTQSVPQAPENQWPALDLGQISQIKRRLDFKAPSPSADSSSINDAIYETIDYIKKEEREEFQMSRPSIKVTQSVPKAPENQWPTVDLGQITQIKRRLDFKAPSPSADSSSNSDSEEDTTGHIKKQEQEDIHLIRPAIKVSQGMTSKPENQWPALDLGQVTQIKRRLDFKTPPTASNDSSFKNDAVHETTGHIKKQVQEELHIIRPPTKVSQTVPKAPENQWPTLDLGQVTQIKRRLDFKAPSPSADSSSINDAVYETIDDIKKEEREELQMSRPSKKVTQSVPQAPENQWPTVDLGQITQIKRRLDFKAPSQGADLSSVTDAVYETTGHIKKQEQEELHIIRPPTKVPQTVPKAPENQWPTLDLGQITQIKRRLDFKAPSQGADLSSFSDSQEETTGQIKKEEQEELHLIRPPIKVSQGMTSKPENQWPALDLGQVTQIKRRLDFKAPLPSADSPSINGAVYETTGHIKKQEQEELHVIRPPTKVSQTGPKAPENQWPTLDLGQITQIKRRLDFKAPSPSADSSSISDSQEETTGHIKKEEQEELHLIRPPIKVSQGMTSKPENQWPALDLGQITQIKKRLDFKALPPASIDSSFKNDAVYETTGHIKKQVQEELHIIRPPTKVSQTVPKAPENQWPALDLGQITQIKRRLDFKAPLPSIDSSSSSGSEKETSGHTKIEEREELQISRPSKSVTQSVTKEPENQWPTVDLGQITQIKRRLDIKTQSSHYLSILNSENTSYQLEENIEPHKLNPIFSSRISDNKDDGIQDFRKLTPLSEPDSDSKWPPLDFRSNLNIKRRLNIKVHSPPESPSSNNESDTMTANLPLTSEGGRTHVGFIPRIGRRLDIKALSPQPYQSFSSTTFGSIKPSFKNESDNENKVLITQERTATSAISTTSEKTFLRSPEVPVNVYHPSKKDHNIKLEKYTVVSDNLENKPTDDTISTAPEITPELQTQWATMNLGISRFRKRLEITSPTIEAPSLLSPPPSDSLYSSSSESGPGRRPRLRRRIVEMQESVHTDSSPILENVSVDVSPSLKDSHDKSSYSDEVRPSVTEEKTKPDTILADFGSQHIKMYQDIWVDEQASPSPLRHHPYSYHRSDSREEETDQSVPDLSLGIPRIKRRLDIKAPSLDPSKTSSFFSKSETDVTEYSEIQSTQTAAELSITYKRSIIKASSLPRNSLAPIGWGQNVEHSVVAREADCDRNSTPVPRTEPSMSFDDIIKRKIRQSRSHTDVDLLHDIRWTGIGHRLSDLSPSKPEDQNTILTSLQQSPLTESHSPPLYSSNSTMKASGKSDVTPVHKYSSLGTEVVPLSSSDTLDMFGISPHETSETSMTVSEDRKERRGLNALKAMSQERKMWQTDFDKDPSALSDDYGPQDDTNFNSSQSETDTKVHSNEPFKHLHSASVEKKKDGDLLLMLYGLPRYKRHDIREPTQEAPPPVPETPPPDD